MKFKQTSDQSHRRKYEGESSLQIIYDMTLEGYELKEIWKVLGIAHAVWYEWKDEIPEIAEVLKKAHEDRKDFLINIAKTSLAKQIQGYTVDERTVETSVGPNGEAQLKSVRTVTKNILPNPILIMYTLNNLDSENFTMRGKLEIEGSLQKPKNLDNVMTEEQRAFLEALK